MSVRAPRLAAAPSDTVAARRPAPRGWPLLRLAFRPFHAGAALFGMLVLPLWGISRWRVAVSAAPAPQPLPWYTHEMRFGFAVADSVGVLPTAGRPRIGGSR